MSSSVVAAIPGLVGASRAMREVAVLVRTAAATDVTVLIEGETGTGKELVARALVTLGPRRARPFVAINCGAVSETMLDAELFGHRHGAFTGALGDRQGLLESAHGGTVFLDEVTSMSASFQARLLRVLENAEVRRVGCDHARRIDVRVIAASNQPLDERVRAGAFRSDLFYRLRVFPISVPPLRDRRDDIPALVEAFVAELRHAGRTTVSGVAPAALAHLVGGDYAGNVRELKNLIVRAAILAGGADRIELPHLLTGRSDAPAVEARQRAMPSEGTEAVDGWSPPSAGDLNAAATGARTMPPARVDLDERRRDAIAELERRVIREALERHGYRMSRAADALGLSRFGLRKRMRRLGLSVARSLAMPVCAGTGLREVG